MFPEHIWASRSVRCCLLVMHYADRNSKMTVLKQSVSALKQTIHINSQKFSAGPLLKVVESKVDEQWGESAAAPQTPQPWNHHLWDQADSWCLCPCLPGHVSHPSVLVSTSMHVSTSCISHALSWWLNSSPSAPLFPLAKRLKWNLYTQMSGTSDQTGWPMGDLSLEGAPSIWWGKNEWQWVFGRLADVGTQRWRRGGNPNGKRHRMGSINEVTETVSPWKLQSKFCGVTRILGLFFFFFLKNHTENIKSQIFDQIQTFSNL